ncbi:hypothetical protein [Streptomyces lavenduligriseus]|uniref:Uncharacterized protein n=1 Tax=Streptomyces lavenduligriseus TaxID=67315 RepID=A0ABT0P5C9_9ACTN|nr:hypothetical protein [Streptomyces lavenduligriseus]MCL3998143.1 hypothetical protein [Streptomyces lavenduligriseus]
MKTTVIERRAELLRLYTGLPWQSALRRVEAAAPEALLIPQPDADQLLLEARVMAALAWRRITTVYPWGIEYVDPYSDRLLIRFEADPVERRDSDETQALELAGVLLPRADEFGGITGVPGARAHVEGGQVVLRMLGTSASVTLQGLDPDEWLRAVDIEDRQSRACGMMLCHRDLPTRWHPAERPYRGPRRRGTAASAWLTSGLLRRVGLIRTLGVPLSVTGWLGYYERGGGERWVIDPTFAEGHGAVGHRRLMALFAAPGWGLPVTPVEEHCNCHLSPGFSDQCTTAAAGLAGRSAVLEVRAIQRRGDRLKWIQERCRATYMAQQQLVLPVPGWVDRWLERGGCPVSDVPVGAVTSGAERHQRAPIVMGSVGGA